ncbi:MAG: hypothetical protein ACR2GX_05475 [Candidatus Dormibacteria bacterium]
MLTGAVGLAGIPGILLVGAAWCYLLPGERRQLGRLVAGLALSAAAALAVSLAVAVSRGAVVEGSFGEVVPGLGLLLRGDSLGVTVSLIALLAGGLSLLETRRRPREEAAILICVAGSCVAALGGNAVLLFGGAEMGNIGALLLIASGRGRVGRGALLAFVIEHGALLGLLLPAAWLQAISGTSDFTALPAGVLSWPLALPWAVAGAVRMLALAIAPGAREPRTSRAWVAAAAVPTAAVILLRLREAEGIAAPAAVTVALAVIGGATAIWGAHLAWRWAGDPRLAGRGLLISAAGWPVALAGVANADAAVAVAFVALEIAVLAAPAWGLIAGAGRWGRILAALALLIAGGLPLGLGTSATILGLGVAASQGRVAVPLLVALGWAAVVATAASLRAARAVVAGGGSREQPVRLDALAAVVLSLVAAVAPGGAAVLTVGPLVGGAAVDSPDAGTIRGPGATWPGGYIVVAALLLALAVMSVALLLDRRLPRATIGGSMLRPSPWVRGLGVRRRLGTGLRVVPGWIERIDEWLIPQPQFGFALVGAFAALFLLR